MLDKSSALSLNPEHSHNTGLCTLRSLREEQAESKYLTDHWKIQISCNEREHLHIKSQCSRNSCIPRAEHCNEGPSESYIIGPSHVGCPKATWWPAGTGMSTRHHEGILESLGDKKFQI